MPALVDIRHVWSPADDSRFISAADGAILLRMIERYGLAGLLGELALIVKEEGEDLKGRLGQQALSINLKIHAAAVAADKSEFLRRR